MVGINRLRQSRQEAGLTQKELGSLVGLSESGYNLIENGNRRITVDRAVKICSLLNKSLDDIFLPSDMANREGGSE